MISLLVAPAFSVPFHARALLELVRGAACLMCRGKMANDKLPITNYKIGASAAFVIRNWQFVICPPQGSQAALRTPPRGHNEMAPSPNPNFPRTDDGLGD